MRLSAGTRIGPYEIISAVGAGGMGEVYRARDSKLNRDVALKVLPDAVAIDPERLARFRREAQVLASLNHPNIAQIYGFEDAPHVPALVMEFVEGQTLAERIAGPMPLDEALPLAAQIAEALEAAHGHNVVHRDLKPANVKLRSDGTVKVLDFGLAKVFEPPSSAPLDGSDMSTLTTPAMTRLGVILGTAAYMSPEQARGKAVDKRGDVWAFGCVLYEMLTGRRAFPGETVSDAIAAILEREPDWTRLAAATPPGIRRLLRRALEKNPKRRLHDMADARIEIEDALAGTEATAVTERRGMRRYWPVLAGALIAAAGLTAAFLLAKRPADRANAYRFVPLAAEEGAEMFPAWSPDGKNIAYSALVGNFRQIFVRSLDTPVPRQVTKASNHAGLPFWSADGTRIFYSTGGGLWSVGVLGGQPQLLLEAPSPSAAGQRNGTALAILHGVGGDRRLWIAATPASQPVPYRTAPFPEKFTRSDSVDFSPDGSKIAVLVEQTSGAGLTFELWILPYPTGQPRIVPGVLRMSPVPFGIRRLSWASDGRHVVLQNEFPEKPGSHLYSVDTENGDVEAVTSGTGDESMPAVSLDGRRIAFASGHNDFDLVQMSLTGTDSRRLLATDRSEREPIWSPTGSRFAYITNVHGRPELWLRSVPEGWSAPVLTGGMEGLEHWYAAERPAFSPDGQQIAYGVNMGNRHAIWISPTAGGRPVPIDLESPDHHGASWSPDGNWISYHRLHAGTWEVVKAPLVAGKAVRLADGPAGGADTAWSPTGEWIAFADTASILLVSPDGVQQRLLGKGVPAAFEFSRDGSLLYALQRGANQGWELVSFDVRSAERKAVPLPVPSTAMLSGLSPHPDGKTFITSVGTARYDIWLLDGFKP